MKHAKPLLLLLLALSITLVCACSSGKDKEQEKTEPLLTVYPPFRAPYSEAGLPENIKWLTNESDPVYASPEAVKGGVLRLAITSFPLTFRVVGPDSNSSFRSAILDNQLSLISVHPNTENIIPEIATHWAFGDDKKTMYFKLNPGARWSDYVPVTAHDFAYTLEFMRSKHIVAPWYNDYYTKEIDRVIVFDDHTLAVVATKAQPDLHLRIALSPTPTHFYEKPDENFTQDYNWKIVPNTGPYQITDFEKGKYVEFSRKKEWWGKDLRYFQNRFNVDRVVYTVVRDYSMLWEYFKKAETDVFGVTAPDFWYDKTRTPVVKNGYVHKIWFFNDTQRSASGLWLNQDNPILADKNVRYAFAHAMNIEKIIETVLRGDYFRLEQGFVGYGQYTNPDIRARRFDLEKVESYMEQAGWTRGADGIWQKGETRFSVDVTYSHAQFAAA